MIGETPPNRPAAAASGTLARTPLVHLLLYALDRRLAGTVELRAPDEKSATVLFVAGRPAKVRTSDPVLFLGRALVELGHLSEDQLTRTLADLSKAKTGGLVLHGQLLLLADMIDEAQLRAGLAEQLQRKLRYVARWPLETKYDYFAGFDALAGWGLEETQGYDPTGMLWRLLTDAPPQGHVDAALDRIATAPLRLTRAAQVSRLGLGREEAAATELLRARPMSVTEFATISGLGAAHARLVTYLLLITKQVEVLRAGSSIPPATEASASIPPLGSLRPSPRPPIMQASVPPNPSKPSPIPREPPKRSVPSPPPASLSQELRERWDEIIDRAATIDRADYFSMLDLARDATHEDVEAAFFALAKQWHPDRLPAELAPVRDACSRVFGRMSEARATLTDAEQRARYMRLMADGSGSPEMQETVARVVEAATNFQKAEVCFRRGDHAQAEVFCRKALEADPTQPDHHALLAWLLALKPDNQTPEKTRSSIQMLDRAIQMSEKCERAFFWRGMLYKRAGRLDIAVRDFKRAVELNPRNIDAAREIRLYHMRGGRRTSNPPAMPNKTGSDAPPKSDETKPGLFGRFFKKP